VVIARRARSTGCRLVSVIRGFLIWVCPSVPCSLSEVRNLLHDLSSGAQDPGPDSSDRHAQCLGDLRIGQAVDGKQKQGLPVLAAEATQGLVETRCCRLGVHPIDQGCREVVMVDGRFLCLQIDPIATFDPAKVVSDHIHPDAIEPRQAIGAIEVVPVPTLERPQKHLCRDVRRLTYTHPSTGKAVDGVVMTREDLSEPGRIGK